MMEIPLNRIDLPRGCEAADAAALASLAETIAQDGLPHALTACEASRDGEPAYEVIIGAWALAALWLLAGRGSVAADVPVRCTLVARDSVVPATDPAAALVGKDAYTAAGGRILADPYDARGAYFSDVDLLDALARKKLEAEAERVRAEGWQWVAIKQRADYAVPANLCELTLYPLPLPGTLREKYEGVHSLYAVLRHQEDPREWGGTMKRMEQELADLRRLDMFTAADIARAGAVIGLAADGTVRIERGFLRLEDAAGMPGAPRDMQLPRVH